MSEIKVNKISPKQTCTQLTLGDSGDTIIIPAGATIQNSGTATGFGATGAVNWDTTPKTTTVTAVSGVGYFVNTTAGAITVNLPAGVAGSIVAISDYANTAATNNITIDPNGTDKINGVNQNAKISTNGASVTLLYVDSTRGWKDINDATLDVTGENPFIAATGGTITTCGDYKIHSFTGPGTFTVTCAGTPAGSTILDYLVVAGGGGAMYDNSGGGGAGGFRYSNSTFPVSGAPGSPLANPTGITASATAYPITVGGGGATAGPPANIPTTGNQGTPSIFSTITSTGGGIGVSCGPNSPYGSVGQPGGSGGGGGQANGPGIGGAGNTPPVSPPQGNAGGNSTGVCAGGGGGGGAMAVGSNTPGPGTGGAGGIGAGLPTAFGSNGTPSGGYRYYAGGGGGGGGQSGGAGGAGTPSTGGGGDGSGPNATAASGTTNTGGGAGGGGQAGTGGSGGSGIVVIRYKFQ
jgi:hypothetical protein